MNYRIKNLKYISFTIKVTLSYIILLMIPISISGVYIYFKYIDTLQSQTSLVFRNELIQKKKYIEQKINEYEKTARGISKNPIILAYLNSTDMSASDRVLYVRNYLNPYYEWINTVDSIRYELNIFTENTTILQNDWIFMARRVEKEKWYKSAYKATSDKPVWEPYHQRRQLIESENYTKTMQTSLFIPLISTNNNIPHSILELYMNTDDLFNSLNDSSVFKNGALFIVDENGKIIFHTDSNYSESYEKLWASSKKKNLSIGNTIDYNGKTFFIKAQIISPFNFNLVGIIPQSEIMKDANSAKLIFILCFSIGSVLLFVISYFLTSGMTSKISNLVKATRKVQTGDLNTRITVKGNDEIAELGQNFNLMIVNINELIEKVYKAEILQKEAQLESLQSQINPHYIYNTLETIKMMAEIKRERGISDALTSLGALLRYNLWGNNKMITIENDLYHIRDYCNLQNMMLNNKLRCNIIADENVQQYKVLKLVLQPIIENAILHGFYGKEGECVIDIHVEKSENAIIFSIKDNGFGMVPERLEKLREWVYGDREDANFIIKGTGVGMRNVHKRIKLNFGNVFGLEIKSVLNKGTEVIIILPIIK